MWSVFLWKTIHVFCNHTFCDVKYFYFLLSKYSLIFGKGPLGGSRWKLLELTSVSRFLAYCILYFIMSCFLEHENKQETNVNILSMTFSYRKTNKIKYPNNKDSVAQFFKARVSTAYGMTWCLWTLLHFCKEFSFVTGAFLWAWHSCSDDASNFVLWCDLEFGSGSILIGGVASPF